MSELGLIQVQVIGLLMMTFSFLYVVYRNIILEKKLNKLEGEK